jgi:hypothetical protein
MASRIERPATAFSHDLSATRLRRPRLSFTRHLAWIRTLPCLITLRRHDGVEAAHIRYGDPAYGKRRTGKQEKPDDRFTVPLHHEAHRTGKDAQHNSGKEREWWERMRIDPLKIAACLWLHTGDDEAAELVIIHAHETAGLS